MATRKNGIFILSVILAAFLMSTCCLGYAFATDPLPKQFKIYVNKTGTVITTPSEGYSGKIIPTVNLFIKTPGCYLNCYSTNPDKGIYTASKDIYVIGLIRVEGVYNGPFCSPRDYEAVDIKDEPIFESLCSKAYQCIGNSCWAGSYTGSLFGLK